MFYFSPCNITPNLKSVLSILTCCIFFLLQFSHLAWVQTDRKSGGLGDLKYPLVSDVTKSISKLFGVLIPDQVCISWKCLFHHAYLLVLTELF